MNSAVQAAGLIWLVIFVYALVGSVDLGASFWRMAFLHRGDREAERIAERYVAPLWEAANVFLVLIAVGLAGFFPGASYAYGTVLLLPLSLVLILLALRGSFLAFAHAAPRPPRLLRELPGATGILLPALLIAVLPVSQGGYVTGGGAHLALALGRLLSSPTVYAYGVFGVAASLFISATFLSDYARTAGSAAALRSYRRQAAWTGPLMMAAGMAALFLLPSPPWWQQRLQAQWPWFAGSFFCFALALAALWRPGRDVPGGERGAGRPRWAVVLVGVQLALADIGYGIAHAPYLLYPQVPTAAGFSNRAIFSGLVWIVVVGLCILVPGFVWLWRLFVLDPRYTQG